MTMKHNITLWLAAGGSLVLSIFVLLDTEFTWRDYVFVCIGIWSMAIGQCWTQFILNHKTTHEKERYPTPAP